MKWSITDLSDQAHRLLNPAWCMGAHTELMWSDSTHTKNQDNTLCTASMTSPSHLDGSGSTAPPVLFDLLSKLPLASPSPHKGLNYHCSPSIPHNLSPLMHAKEEPSGAPLNYDCG